MGNRRGNLVSTPRCCNSSGAQPSESDRETIASVLDVGNTSIFAKRITLIRRCLLSMSMSTVCCFYISMSELTIDGEQGESFSGRAFCNISSSNSAVISRLVSSGSKAACAECSLT